jgi:DNA-binding NarL/FixJ family response regulator
MKYITVVDDAPDLGRVLQQMMLTLSRDLIISVVPSAEEAFLDSDRHPVDLLVTDLRLPGISGVDLVKKFRGRHPAVRVILITGLSDGPVVQQARAMQPDFFFFKPLDFPEFLRAVSKCLEMPTPDVLRVATAQSPTRPVPQPALVPEQPASKPTTSPLGSLVSLQSEPEREILPDVLSGLRQSLGALAVFVLNDSGHIVAQAGDLPKFDLETDWVPVLFGALSAAEKVTRLVKGQEASHVQGYNGKDFDLAMTSFGSLALLAVLPKGRSALRLALAFEELLAVRNNLLAIFDRMGLIAQKPVQPAPVEAPLEPAVITEMTLKSDRALENLEKIIKESAAEIKPGDADAFWESAQSTGKPSPSSPDMITYDQAARLGLAPKENRDTPPEQ